MSLAVARRFNRACAADLEIAAQLAKLGADPSIEDVAAIATAEGFECTAEELHRAYAADWALSAIIAGNSLEKLNRLDNSRASAR